MFARYLLSALAAILSVLPMITGCVMVNGATLGPQVWTEPDTEDFRIDTEGLDRIEVQTANGAITYTGHTDSAPLAVIAVTKRAAGLTLADAEEALDALEVYVEDRGEKTLRIGWRWATPRESHWGAEVSYTIDAPDDVALKAETHNGAIRVKGIAGDTRLVTHNGQIDVQSAGEKLTVETHNGSIKADVSRSRTVAGTVATHNGQIRMMVGDHYGGDLTCRTHNGHIRCDLPWTVRHASRGHLSGTVGEGDSSLKATTHNGSIRIDAGS